MVICKCIVDVLGNKIDLLVFLLCNMYLKVVDSSGALKCYAAAVLHISLHRWQQTLRSTVNWAPITYNHNPMCNDLLFGVAMTGTYRCFLGKLGPLFFHVFLP